MAEPIKNEMRSMTDFSYENKRLDKSQELNSSMSINPNNGNDEYGQKVMNVFGGER